MNEVELDEMYGELCRGLDAAGQEQAPLVLARFALLAMHRIADPAVIRDLVRQAMLMD
ncbi:MAG: hypothetical protein JSR95_14825 [Proteobacteria bacterium]|nr:hypothetical protein [Pseudomonadota bacterium]